jgi:hypothetical protein
MIQFQVFSSFFALEWRSSWTKGKFRAVTGAELNLRKYSIVKFIFNAGGLMEMSVGRRTFEENLKLVVWKWVTSERYLRSSDKLFISWCSCRTIENHIDKKPECHSCVGAQGYRRFIGQRNRSRRQTRVGREESSGGVTNAIESEHSGVSAAAVGRESFSYPWRSFEKPSRRKWPDDLSFAPLENSLSFTEIFLRMQKSFLNFERETMRVWNGD